MLAFSAPLAFGLSSEVYRRERERGRARAREKQLSFWLSSKSHSPVDLNITAFQNGRPWGHSFPGMFL